MRRTVGISLFLLSFCLTHAVAQERADAEAAKALLKKAAAHYKTAGRAAALKDFNDKQGAFIDRDLYVFCFGPDKKISAHGANVTLIGKDLDIFKDGDGKAFVTELNEAALQKGSAEVSYRWVNPLTKKLEQKSSTAEKMGEDVCVVGYYK